MNYRISKYSPSCRDINEAFTLNTWTSVSDIGKIFDNKKFCAIEYLDIEEKYWRTLRYFLGLYEIKRLKVQGLEMNSMLPSFFSKSKYFCNRDFKKYLREGSICPLKIIEIITRLCLRNQVWCRLQSDENDYIHFGYDYYMYFGSRRNIEVNIDTNKIPLGIYVEVYDSPYMATS